MTHSSETEIFSGWSEWKSCSPRHIDDMPCWQKSQLPYKNWLLAPKIVSSGQLEPRRSMFSTWKRCLIVSLLWGYQKLSFIPPKNGVLAKFGLKLAFLAKYWHFWPIWYNARPKNQCGKVVLVVFRYVGIKILLTHIKIWIFGQIWPNTDIFGQILAFLAYLVLCPTINNGNKVPSWFFRYVGTKTLALSCKN